MAQLSHFFRWQNDEIGPLLSPFWHSLILLVFILGLFWAWYYAPRWRGTHERRLLRPLWRLLAVLWLAELLWRTLFWQWSDFWLLAPWWFAQWGILLTPPALHRQSPLLLVPAFIGAWGILLPFGDCPYRWPHLILALSLMQGWAAGWYAFDAVLAAPAPWPRERLRASAMALVFYGGWLWIWDHWSGRNDGYLMAPPEVLAPYLSPGPAYSLAVIAGYGLCTWAVGEGFCRVQAQRGKIKII